MAPLNPYKDRLLFLDGLDLKSPKSAWVIPTAVAWRGFLLAPNCRQGHSRPAWVWRASQTGRRWTRVIATRQQHGSQVPLARVLFGLVDSRVARRARCRSPQTKSPTPHRTNRSHRKSTRYRRSNGFLVMPLPRPLRPPRTPKLSRFWMQCWINTDHCLEEARGSGSTSCPITWIRFERWKPA